MVAYPFLGAVGMLSGQYPTPTRYGPAYRRTGVLALMLPNSGLLRVRRS